MNNVKTAKKYFNSIKLASFFIILGTTIFIQQYSQDIIKIIAQGNDYIEEYAEEVLQIYFLNTFPELFKGVFRQTIQALSL